jgi:hypothetical protein
MRGVPAGWQNRSDDPYERLLMGIVRQAAVDARRGDRKAAAWLREVAPGIYSRLFGESI